MLTTSYKKLVEELGKIRDNYLTLDGDVLFTVDKEDTIYPTITRVVMKLKDSGSAARSKSLRSTATNSMLSRPALDASSRAYVIASWERSIPTNRLLG